MDSEEFVAEYYRKLSVADVEALVEWYAPDAEIVRYDGVANDRAAIGRYHREFLDRHGSVALQSIDQLRESDDVLMWDALVATDRGLLQAVHVVVFDDDARIRRHMPGMRGYWGR